MSAAEAIQLLKPIYSNSAHAAKMAVCKRAHGGMIHARAEQFINNGKDLGSVEILKGFWWAEGHEALHQDWQTGDFDTWIDRRIHLQAFGVQFFRKHIEKM